MLQEDIANRGQAEIPIRRGSTKQHFSRYSLVSVFSTGLGIVLLFVLNSLVGIYAPVANVLAALIGSPPIYLLCRFWAWHDQPIESEVAALARFAMATAVSVVVATAAIYVANKLWGDGLIAVGAAIASYGTIWLVRFAYFDAVVFAR